MRALALAGAAAGVLLVIAVAYFYAVIEVAATALETLSKGL
ncbi:membrane protein [Arthrobacter phage Klevey]|uniref:Membrane protein n=1 Tax=Arthrobacter phage Klevey TaxID=2867481 RepID=A0AAE8XKX0_9CAUD|nr:membrane protein [Arthrobacter phage Klevey]